VFRTVKTEGLSGASGRTTTGFDPSGGGGGREFRQTGAGGDRGDCLAHLAGKGSLENPLKSRGERQPCLKDMVVGKCCNVCKHIHGTGVCYDVTRGKI
jgi:hypothetical protein